MKYLKIFLTLLPVFFVISLFYFTPRLIKVNNISCKSQYGPCSQIFSEEAFKYEHKSLKEAEGKLASFFKSSPFVKEYSFSFKFPDKLVINIIEAKAKYALGNREMGYCPIDKDGVCLRLETATILPSLEREGNPPNVGEKVNPQTLFALELISSLFSTYGVKEGKLSPAKLEASVEGYDVIFPLEGDREVLLGSLELILSRLKSPSKDSKIDYSQVAKIDLRFKNPVLQ